MLAILLAAPLLVSACGDAAKQRSQTASVTHVKTPVAQAPTTQVSDPASRIERGAPSEVVAKVGQVRIMRGAVQHQMFVAASGSPVPDAPSYAVCVARLRAASKTSAPDARRLRLNCEQRYRQLFQTALGTLIHNRWLIGEAADEGVRVTGAEVEHEFQLSRKANFTTDAQFAQYLMKTGRTTADVMLELRVGKLTDGIFARIRRQQRPATQAQVAGYYAQHKQQFTIPPGRNVRIVRTTTRAGALAAKQELQSGTSFESVAKRFSSIAQPVRSKDGLVIGLVPGFYSEPPLNNAIFAARPGRVYGPVFISKPRVLASEPVSGYFVFEVVGSHPGHLRPLKEVRSELASVLTEHQKTTTLADAVKVFRRRWKAKTDCMPGYVIDSCRQAKPASGAPADPYTL